MSNQRKGVPKTGHPGDREGARASDRKSNEKNTTRSRDEKEAPSDYNPSGHREPRESRSRGRAKKLAEAWAFQSVGDASYWEEYIEEAKEKVEWNDYVKWLKRKKGYEYIESYPYLNPEGDLLYEVCRFEYALLRRNKLFIPRHKEDGKWVRFMPPVRVPYNLPKLLKRLDEEITLVEGEKGANATMKKGILTTCVHGQQWRNETATFFTDRIVNIAMDNDASGRANIETAREMLSQVEANMRVIELPGLRPGKGLDDWLEDHSIEEYLALVAKTPIEGRITATPHTFPAEETIPRDEWLLGKHLLRGEVSITAATTGTGKSTLAIAQALSMASGKQLLHDTVPKHPLRVILVNLEDRRDRMDKRIAAAMRQHGLIPVDIGDRLIVIAKGEIKIKIAKQLRSGDVERNEEEIKELTALVLEHKADVISIDSLIRTHAVHENDNKAMEAVIECLEEIAQKGNCAIHPWHHTRKLNGEQASIEALRGAQSITDAGRSTRILEKMTKKERDNIISVLPDMKEAGYYFREFNGKRNFAPPTDESQWFELANIKLRNYRSEFEDDGDYVGVVTRWYYPKIELPQITDYTISLILKAIRDGGPWRANPSSKKEPWVGVPIAKVLELNPSIKQAKNFITELIEKLLADGKLKEVTRPDAHREPKEYIEAAAVPEPGTAENDGENS